MNSDEYIQLLKNGFELSKKLNSIEEIIPFINQIRLLHKKLQKDLEYFFIDPISYEKQEEKDKIIAIAKEIKEVCITSGVIKYEFYKLPIASSEFRSLYKSTKRFARYYYNSIDITDIIVFIANDKKYKYIKNDLFVDMVDDKDISLNELNFTEEKEDSNIIDYTKFKGNELDALDRLG